MSKRVLITGAGGFVGPYLIKELQKTKENEIFASIYSSSSDISTLLPSSHIIEGDLTNQEYSEALLEKASPDIIYHLASLSQVSSSAEETTKVITTNTLITYNVLEATKRHKPSARLISVCSGNVYGKVKKNELPIKESNPLRPLNPYAVSKISQEYLSLEYHYAHKLDIVILRPFNHTGPGQLDSFVVPSFAKQFASILAGHTKPVIEVGNLDTARDFTDVRDMVRAYVLAGDKGLSGEIYNIGSGTSYTIRQIVALFSKLANIKVSVHESKERLRTSDVPILTADSTKFRKQIGWQPTITFEQTIGDVLQYWGTKK